ncbi:MAG: response regulator [Terriglobales bacterium]|jgi:CheY-like chemotaxis protein
MRILWVDDDIADNEDLQNLFKAELVGAGRIVNNNMAEWLKRIETKIAESEIKVEFVGDGDSALQRYCEHSPYDLVITDVYHPGLEGVELCKAIRRRNPSQALIVYGRRNRRNRVVDTEPRCSHDKQVYVAYAALARGRNRRQPEKN